METLNFGEHYMVDAYMCDKDLLSSAKQVEWCIEEILLYTGMHKISEIITVTADDNFLLDPGGISSMVIIAESHVSIHTFPDRRFFSMDCYTCKNNMDTDGIYKILNKYFDIWDAEINFVKRGTRYPASNIL